MLPGSKSREGWQSRLFCLFRFGCCVCLGLTPWLFILIQYGRLGPFDGLDHGLPRAYFWGAPTSWAEALSHLAGGSLRGKVFRLPDGSALVAVALELGRRLRFEWGALGLALGVLGCWRLLWQNWRVWLGSAWVAAITAIYFASLSQAVQDALVFTLPLLLPWALWVAVGAAALAQGAAALVAIASKAWVGGWSDRRQTIVLYITFTLLLLLTLSWGRSRMPYGNKADQWLFREFGAGALAQVEQGATVMTRWEQGMTLQYLRLAEGSRPDVWIDVSEPEDEPWDLRARRRYPGRPIYIVGSAADADRLGAVRVWGTDYATLFRLVESEKH